MKNKTSVFLNIILCLSVCFFAACNKESGPTTVNGTVRDITTNIGVSNAELGLFETDGESAFGLGGVLMEEKYSDASGEFTFNFDAREGFQYYVQAIKEEYFNNQSSNITFVNNLGDIGELEVFLEPESFVLLNIKNILPASTFDGISLNTPFSEIGVIFYGSEIDTSIIIHTYGNTENKIVAFIYNMGSLISQETYLIYAPSFDTTNFEILY